MARAGTGRAKAAKSPTVTTQVSIEEQISRAELAVHRNKAASDTLHRQWKTQLMYMSFLLAFIGFHQLQSRVSPCLMEIKKFNASQTALQERITGLDAARIILHDAMECVIGLVMTFSLVRFVSSRRVHSRAGFSTSLSYMIANACVPIILSLNFKQMRNPRTSASCIVHLVPRVTVINEPEASPPSASFPVVIIFHVISTACIWFMDVQAKRHEKNIQLVEQLRDDLATSAGREPSSAVVGQAAKLDSDAPSKASRPSPSNGKDKKV
jgi:hypothetical protein